jgi:L-methionine (R)-S-oxide reductase
MALYPTVADHYELHLALCQKLQRENPHYNWVGFYWMDDADQALHLGAYVGTETDHVRIPYGRGICGQVAESGETFLVPDVQAQDNYLACSIETKAEIVVPVYKDGKLVGQLDIDSHKRDPFSSEDQAYLEQVCAAVALLL